MPEELVRVMDRFGIDEDMIAGTGYGSCLFANKPGDGSAREQAASCQKVLGGIANLCFEYATKRYRSNCINWGIILLLWMEGKNLTVYRGIIYLLRVYARLC